MSELTQERLKELLSYNPDNGVFTWLVSKARYISVGDSAGTKTKDGYIRIGISGKYYRAHRLAWLYVFGIFPDDQIDHINGVRDDNRMANLRDVTVSVNLQNQKKAPSHNKAGLLGVSKHQGKYMARIRVYGELKYLGYFNTPESAHQTYLAAKRRYHQGCTI